MHAGRTCRGDIREIKAAFFLLQEPWNKVEGRSFADFFFFLVETIIYNSGRYTSSVMFIHYPGCEGRQWMDGVTITTARETLTTLFTERFHSKTYNNIFLVHTVG